MADRPQSTPRENALRESFLTAIEQPDAHEGARAFGVLLHDLVYEADVIVKMPTDSVPSPAVFTRRQFIGAIAELRQAMAAFHELATVETGRVEEMRIAVAAHDALAALEPIASKLEASTGQEA